MKADDGKQFANYSPPTIKLTTNHHRPVPHHPEEPGNHPYPPSTPPGGGMATPPAGSPKPNC